MQYKQDISEKMLQDRRYKGIVTAKKRTIWKHRGVIPDKYFNQSFIQLYEQGYIERANLVKDPYFNENLIVKNPLTPNQKVLQERLIEILQSEKINAAEVIRQAGIKQNYYRDAIREDPQKQVDMMGHDLISLRKNLNSLRLKINKVISPLIGKKEFDIVDVESVDNLFRDKRLVLICVINHNYVYRYRVYSRQRKKMNLFEHEEIQFYIHYLTIFTAETAI